jgi:hypothetical protein
VARRRTSRPDNVDHDVDEVPQWVLDGESVVAAIARLRADPSLWTAEGHAGVRAEARRNAAAAREWCEARGLSYTMVHGAAIPSAAEVRDGYTEGAGPKHERTQAYIREHR